MIFSSCKSEHTLTSDSWFEVVARHSQNGPAFLSTDWAASHLLLGEPDINLWRTAGTTYDIHHDVDGAWVAPMHMASKCWAGSMDASWPSIWYGLFNGCQHQSISLRFACCSSLFWGICSRLSNFCLSHSWHGSLLSSWIAKGAAASLQFLRPVCLCQTSSLRSFLSQRSWSLCVSHFPCWECKVFNAWSNIWKSMELRKFWNFQMVSYILWYPCQISDIMTSFVALCCQMWARLRTVQ